MHWTIHMTRRPSLDLHSHNTYFSRSINNQPCQQPLFQTRLSSLLRHNYIIWRSSARAALIVSSVYTFRQPLRPFFPSHIRKKHFNISSRLPFFAYPSSEARTTGSVCPLRHPRNAMERSAFRSYVVVSREIIIFRLAIAFRSAIMYIHWILTLFVVLGTLQCVLIDFGQRQTSNTRIPKLPKKNTQTWGTSHRQSYYNQC